MRKELKIYRFNFVGGTWLHNDIRITSISWRGAMIKARKILKNFGVEAGRLAEGEYDPYVESQINFVKIR